MATPNVEFYQQQKAMQDKVTKSEQERQQLEKELKLLMQTEHNSFQLKAAKLHSYWNKVCADEKRAKQRNAMLVREFERIDAHLSSMTARTERLRFLKQQYADYVARTYPQWTIMVEQKMREATQQEQGHLPESPGIRRSQDWTEAEKEDSTSISEEDEQQQQTPLQQQLPTHLPADKSRSENDTYAVKVPVTQSIQRAQQSTPLSRVRDVRNVSARTTASENAFKAAVVRQPDTRSAKMGPSRSEYVNIAPFSEMQAVPPHAGQGDQQSVRPERDDFSDFGSGSDLPLSGGDAVPIKAASVKASSRLASSRADSVQSQHSSESLLPELTVDGLVYLLRHIEAELDSRQEGTKYYGSPILSSEEKSDLIQLANAGEALQGFSGSKASHLVLEQMSHIVRRLPEECLISEELLSRPLEEIRPSTIGDELTEEAQRLWIAVFTHFIRLHTAGVMEAKEIAAVFVPCLVADKSQHQDKAFALLVGLLDDEDGTDASSIASPQQPGSPHNLRNSNSFIEGGKVPPLKISSLTEKPLSDDDESSFFDQTLPKEPVVPLSELPAYKHFQRAPLLSDDTDDDVEKQVANVISPQTFHTIFRPKEPSQVVSKPVAEPDSHSEPSSRGPKPPVYVPTAVEQRSVFGPIGSKQKRPGFLLSDLDTDSEMEPRIFGSSQMPTPGEDKDFDFYD